MSDEQEAKEKPTNKLIFVNCVDGFVGQNLAKVSKIIRWSKLIGNFKEVGVHEISRWTKLSVNERLVAGFQDSRASRRNSRPTWCSRYTAGQRF